MKSKRIDNERRRSRYDWFVAVVKQQACEHPQRDIVEQRGSPPIRVCTLCGYAEEGWGAGYSKLTNQSVRVACEEARISRVGAVVTQNDMEKLGRYKR